MSCFGKMFSTTRAELLHMRPKPSCRQSVKLQQQVGVECIATAGDCNAPHRVIHATFFIGEYSDFYHLLHVHHQYLVFVMFLLMIKVSPVILQFISVKKRCWLNWRCTCRLLQILSCLTLPVFPFFPVNIPLIGMNPHAFIIFRIIFSYK